MTTVFVRNVNKFLLVSISIPIAVFGAPNKNQKPAAKAKVLAQQNKKPPVDMVPTLRYKGKKFKIPNLEAVVTPNELPIQNPNPFVSKFISPIKMPEIKIMPSLAPSKISAAPKFSEKFQTLNSFLVKIPWAGASDQRLSPQWSSPTLPPAEMKAQEIDIMSEGEFKLLEAMLLLKSKETIPLSIGLANPLLKIPDSKSFAEEILGRGLQSLSIRTAANEHFNHVIINEKEPNRVKRNINYVLESLKANDYDEAHFLIPYIEKRFFPTEYLGNFPLAKARTDIEKKNLQAAWETLSNIDPKKPQNYEARFLRATIHYRSNDVNSASKEMASLLESGDKIPKDLKSLTAATLAQIYFQQGKYKDAFNTYRLVDQSHPIWLETLVESAWSQILNKDYEGAAGNMFSLHTNYFKGAYKPESYIVRTVSYLQLCQFGDALSTLKDFLRKYKFAQKQLQAYKLKNPNHLEVIRDFLKAGTPNTFAGLPRSLLVEIGRDPKFIDFQKRLNEIEEDNIKLSQLPDGLIKLDQKFAMESAKYSQSLKNLEGYLKTASDPTKKQQLAIDKASHLKRIEKFQLLRRIIQDAKLGVSSEYKGFMPLITKRKDSLKNNQQNVLKESFANLEKDLNHWLDQSELLFYEIHNGAGEHIRYQMAASGGSDRTPANEPAKVYKKEEKDLQWEFDGEIWEDEVGHYRSSLENVCAEDE